MRRGSPSQDLDRKPAHPNGLNCHRLAGRTLEHDPRALQDYSAAGGSNKTLVRAPVGLRPRDSYFLPPRPAIGCPTSSSATAASTSCVLSVNPISLAGHVRISEQASLS